MVTGKLERRFAGWLSRKPQSFCVFSQRNCGLPLIFGWRLAGWLSRSFPQHLPIPDGSARAWQECGLQTGASKIKTK